MGQRGEGYLLWFRTPCPSPVWGRGYQTVISRDTSRTGLWGIPHTGPGVSPSHRQYTSSRSIHQGCVHRKPKGINIVALQFDEIIHFLPKWHQPALPSCFMKRMTLQPYKMAQSLFNTVFQTVCLKLLQLNLARCLLKHTTTPPPNISIWQAKKLKWVNESCLSLQNVFCLIPYSKSH